MSVCMCNQKPCVCYTLSSIPDSQVARAVPRIQPEFKQEEKVQQNPYWPTRIYMTPNGPVIEPVPEHAAWEKENNKHDPVNHPSHYTSGGIEVIDFIEAKKFNYNLGNAVKYISRSGLKGNKKQDLEKAIWYLKRELENGA